MTADQKATAKARSALPRPVPVPLALPTSSAVAWWTLLSVKSFSDRFEMLVALEAREVAEQRHSGNYLTRQAGRARCGGRRAA